MLNRIRKFVVDAAPKQLAEATLDGTVKKDGLICYKGEGIFGFLSRTFGSDDSTIKTVRGKRVYLNDGTTLLAAFLGLPTFLAKGETQSWPNIGRRFIGWKENNPLWLNRVGVPIFILFNTAAMLLKLTLNIVKLVTEVLPHLLFVISALLRQLAPDLARTMRGLITEPLYKGTQSTFGDIATAFASVIGLPVVIVLGIAAAIAAAVSGVWYLLGQSVTSPITALGETWTYCTRTEKPRSAYTRFINNFIRPLMFVLRLLISVAAYGAIAAVALPPLIALLAPIVPAALAPVVSTITSAIAATLQSLTSVVPAIASIPAITAQLFLLGAAIGAIVAGVGAITRGWTNRLSAFLYTEPPKPGIYVRKGKQLKGEMIRGTFDARFENSFDDFSSKFDKIAVNAPHDIFVDRDTGIIFAEKTYGDLILVQAIAPKELEELLALDGEKRLMRLQARSSALTPAFPQRSQPATVGLLPDAGTRVTISVDNETRWSLGRGNPATHRASIVSTVSGGIWVDQTDQGEIFTSYTPGDLHWPTLMMVADVVLKLKQQPAYGEFRKRVNSVLEDLSQLSPVTRPALFDRLKKDCNNLVADLKAHFGNDSFTGQLEAVNQALGKIRIEVATIRRSAAAAQPSASAATPVVPAPAAAPASKAGMYGSGSAAATPASPPPADDDKHDKPAPGGTGKR